MSTIGTSHEAQTLRQELADTHKKLQEYADTIVSLHGELRALRDAICISCKHKLVLGNIQAAEPPAPSSSLVKSSQGPAKRNNSRFSWRRLQAHASDPVPSDSGPPTSEIPGHTSQTSSSVLTTTQLASTSKPLITTASSEAITPNAPPSVPQWFAQKDATANAALDVTFIRAFAHKGEVRSVRFSADGKYLAAVVTVRDKNGVIFVYNVETGDKECELSEHSSRYSSVEVPGIYSIGFSPSGRYLVVGNGAGPVTVWDVLHNRIRNVFRGHKARVESVDFSPNGRLVLSGSWDGAVCLWNMRDGSVKVLTDDAHIFYTVRFSSDEQVVAGDSDGIIRVWDVRTGQLVRRWIGHKGTVWSVAFTLHGSGLVSSGNDGVVKCWDASSLEVIQSGREPAATRILECDDRTSSVYAVAVSPDGQWIASGFFDGRTVIWDAHTAMRQCTLIGHPHAVFSAEFSPVGGYLALGSYDRHVTLWRYGSQVSNVDSLRIE